MKHLLKYISVICLVLLNSYAYAEGTKQIMKTENSHGKISITPEITSFATYNCPEKFRLNIHVADISEKICIGLGDPLNASNNVINTLYYRIKDPSGNIIKEAALTPQIGETGYINTYNEAVAGPNIINPAGYDPIIISPQTTGDYYIEFKDSSTLNDRAMFSFFDISVIKEDNVIDGRLWSKGWYFISGSSYNDEFDGKVFVYSTDKVVTSIDFNGIKPFGFSLFCNAFGLNNSGNFVEDRKSKKINPKEIKAFLDMLPEYKIFLNDPDPGIFPSNSIDETYDLTLDYYGKNFNSFCFDINAPLEGTVEVTLNLNGIPNFQKNSEDIQLYTKVTPGSNCLPWDGINGLGVQMPDSFICDISYQYISGLTNLPMYDIERNENGIIVEIVRPMTSKSRPDIFWDDSEISYWNGSTVMNGTTELNGCTDISGCHTWDAIEEKISAFKDTIYSLGEETTINTWWYSGYSSVTIENFVIDLSMAKVENNIPNVLTPNSDGINDVFATRGIDDYPGSSLLIYNRWGALVYEDDNYTSANYWKCTNQNGKPVANGTYYYILNVKNYKTLKGYITIINNTK